MEVCLFAPVSLVPCGLVTQAYCRALPNFTCSSLWLFFKTLSHPPPNSAAQEDVLGPKQNHVSYPWITFWLLHAGLRLLIWEYLLPNASEGRGFRGEPCTKAWLHSGLRRRDSRRADGGKGQGVARKGSESSHGAEFQKGHKTTPRPQAQQEAAGTLQVAQHLTL